MFAGAMVDALPLLIAVVIGGQIGSLMAVRVLPLKWIPLADRGFGGGGWGVRLLAGL